MSYEIITYTGKTIDLLNPNPDSIDIHDIAHSLSLQCRFTGHTDRFYSVAEHSLNVSKVASKISEEYALVGLMHDAAEAYVGDVSTPLANAMASISDVFAEIKSNIEYAIAHKYGFDWPMPPVVHEIDKRMFATEASFLFSPPRKTKYEPLAYKINDYTMLPELARENFLEVFYKIEGKVSV